MITKTQITIYAPGTLYQFLTGVKDEDGFELVTIEPSKRCVKLTWVKDKEEIHKTFCRIPYDVMEFEDLSK